MMENKANSDLFPSSFFMLSLYVTIKVKKGTEA